MKGLHSLMPKALSWAKLTCLYDMNSRSSSDHSSLWDSVSSLIKLRVKLKE